jgi:hypothetical protein
LLLVENAVGEFVKKLVGEEELVENAVFGVGGSTHEKYGVSSLVGDNLTVGGNAVCEVGGATDGQCDSDGGGSIVDINDILMIVIGT